MRKKIKMTGYIVIVILLLLAIIYIVFIYYNPQFGKSLTRKQIKEFEKYDNFQNGKFKNFHETSVNMNYKKLLKDLTKNKSNRKPRASIPVEKVDTLILKNYGPDKAQIIWFGHSTFLLVIDGKKILFDPMLTSIASPISFLGPKRFSNELPITAEQLPYLDMVVVSHDHYDHLDYKTILAIKDKVGHFIVPLGISNHLEKWGVNRNKITELNWWQAFTSKEIVFTCTPARHFSGRGIFNRETTLWASWVIEGKKNKIFFSGDGGYDTHFKEIGEKFGPFDISLLECGQYNENWKLIHMMPEQTAQAGIDLNSKLVLPVHWGSFSLAFHDWTDPVERILKKSKTLNLQVTTPKIGQPITIGQSDYPKEKWWNKLD